MKINQQKRKGFTLIELMVVISIIALLSSVVLAAVTSARQKAQMSKVRSEMAEFVKALEIYRTSYGSYPSSAGYSENSLGGVCSLTNSATSPCLSAILTDLKTKKIYTGNLATILTSTPNYKNDYYFYYTNTQIGFTSLLSELTPPVLCNNKALNTSSEYFLSFQVTDKNNNSISGFDSTYIGKEYGNGALDGSFCSPNR